jgi:hypothetical protein
MGYVRLQIRRQRKSRLHELLNGFALELSDRCRDGRSMRRSRHVGSLSSSDLYVPEMMCTMALDKSAH